jgi:hypothetical protein
LKLFVLDWLGKKEKAFKPYDLKASTDGWSVGCRPPCTIFELIFEGFGATG